MVTATVLAIFFVPLFFVVVVRLFDRKRRRARAEKTLSDAAPQGRP